MTRMFGRRAVLRGSAGVVLALPLLESFGPREARGAEGDAEPFAIFFRQGCGVATAQDTEELGAEPERFWPHAHGPLDAANLDGRALDELTAFADRLLVIDNVHMSDFEEYGDGHARGALQSLTGRGPTVPGAAGDSEAAGESLDHRIGRELNPDGRDSLFMYAGQMGGWLGGPCISYRGAADRRAALHDPLQAYMTIMGVDASSEELELLVARQKSVNDFVRDRLHAFMARPELSRSDRDRLELHLQSIRDLENTLACNLTEDEAAMLDGASAGYDSDDGDRVLSATRVHMDIAALAVACGYTRSVAIQVGNGNDGSTRYRNLDTGQLMGESFHYVSHRRRSDDSSGSIIEGSDVLHHHIDRQFAQTFRHLLERLDAYVTPSGDRLLDAGVAVWFNDLANGPAHAPGPCPFILAGSAGGFFRQGEFVEAAGYKNHHMLLSTIGSAVGLRNGNGDYLDDFGDPSLERGILDTLLA